MQKNNISQMQDEDSQAYDDFRTLQYEDFALFPDAVVTVNPHTAIDVNPQNQQYMVPRNLSEDEIFKGLPNIAALDSVFASHDISSNENLLPSKSSGKKSKSVDVEGNAAIISEMKSTDEDNKRLKQTRSVNQKKLHNLSERKRRNKIRMKMNTLQALVPNCSKTDRVSMLSDAVEYLKFLKFEVEMRQRQAMLQVGVQNNSTQQIPQYMPCMPMGIGMGMGMGMGMVNLPGNYSAGGTSQNFLSVPSTPTPNLPVFSEPTVVSFPQFQAIVPVPPSSFMAAQVIPTSSTNTIVQPQLIPYRRNPTNQGESSTSQYITTMDHNLSESINSRRER